MEHIQFFFAEGTWWLYLLLVALSAAFAWYTYSYTEPMLPSSQRWWLGGLRTLGLAMLLVALFVPVLRYVASNVMRQPIYIAVDVSRSLTLKDASGSREEKIRAAIQSVRAVLPTAPMVAFAGRTDDVEDDDSLSFNGKRTDFSQLVQSLVNRHGIDRPGVVVVLSDGNNNSGEQPMHAADQSGIGWYTVGVGDTAVPVDATVSGIVTGTVAIVRHTSTVSATLSSVGLRNVPQIISLFEDGTVVAKDTVIPTARKDRQMVHFSWTPRTSGQRKLTVVSSTSTPEATLANNSASQYVHVRSDERVVNLIAGQPSSDLAFIRNQLESDPTLTVQVFVQKQGSTFYEASPAGARIESARATVLVGFPISSTPLDIVQRIARLCEKGGSLMFLPNSQTDYTKLAPLEPFLPFTVVSARGTEMMVTANVPEAAATNPLMKITGTQHDEELWNSLPPIYRSETYVQPSAGAEVLATMRVNNVPVPEPLIIQKNTERSRSLAVLGYGLYRWKLLANGPQASRGETVSDVFAAFVTNGMAWLSADDKDQRIRITPSRRFYMAGEVVELQASVLDDTYMPVNAADVRVDVTGAKFNRTVVLAAIGGGRYVGTVGALPSGDYSYSGTVRNNSRVIGSDQGRFSVDSLGLEDADVTQNVELLKALSLRTGAVYGSWDSAADVARAALADNRHRERAITTERDSILWHLPWPLCIALLAFSLEWFLRKRRGLL